MFHSSRKLLLLVGVLMLTFVVMSGALMAAPSGEDAGLVAQLEQQGGGKLHLQIDHVTGNARYIGSESGLLTSEFAGKYDSAEATARAFLASYGSLLGIANQATDLRLTAAKSDELGMSHVRFAQVHGGVNVFGADLVVHLNKEGAVTSVNGLLLSDLAGLNTVATLKSAQAGTIAATQVSAKDATATESSLVVLKPGLITDKASDNYLTYRVRVDSVSQPELAKWVFVDAHSGEIRFSHPAAYDARNRRTYNLEHRTQYSRAILARTESQAAVTSAPNCTATDVNRAHDYAGNTYDFYFSRFGRDSYNNAGAALDSYVCYGRNYQNAFWDGRRMTYGDGFASADDVVAHELTHAVTENESNLVYSNQSGALNESFSDIFGEAVDLTNGSGSDSSGVRWDMGEDIPGFGAIRDMMDPTRFSDPDRTNSPYYYCGTSDNGGVHSNSGVPNKAFALMVDGGNFNGYNVTAIGIDKAVQIQYRANASYLTSSAKLRDAYNALNNSCSDLYGAGSADCANVRTALDAVVMNGSVCGAP